MTIEESLRIITTCDESDFQEALKVLEVQEKFEGKNMMTRQELNEALQGTVRVTFTKADGTERVMTCTQNPDLMNIAMAEYNEDPRPQTDNVRVYDIEASGWRSFNMPTVTSAEVVS